MTSPHLRFFTQSCVHHVRINRRKFDVRDLVFAHSSDFLVQGLHQPCKQRSQIKTTDVKLFKSARGLK